MSSLLVSQIASLLRTTEDLEELREIESALARRFYDVYAEPDHPLPREGEDIFSVGQTVRFVNGIAPKYLSGLTATVVRINRKTVTVSTPDQPEYRRFRGRPEVRCPRTLMEVAV